MLIKQFGETYCENYDSPKNNPNQWYQEEGKEKTKCGETEIDRLWAHWVNRIGSNREVTDGYIIFKFSPSLEIIL